MSTVWNDIQQVYADPRAYKDGNKSDVEVIKEFSGGQKPEELLKRVIEMSTDEGDLILDYHLGTGTTIATAHKLNRRYIGIEQMQSQIDIIISRMQKVLSGEKAGISKDVNWIGGGDFVYCELKENGQELINYVLDANENNIDEIKEKIVNDDRIISYITKNEIKEANEEFNNLSLEEKKKALISLIDKNKLYINYSDMDDMNYNIPEEEKSFTKSFYEGV